MAHPVPPRLSPASCGLSWQTHSVQRCGLPAPDRHRPALKLLVRAVKKSTRVEAWAPLLLKGLSAALRRDAGPEVHAGKRGQFGAGQGGPIPERFVGTPSKPKVPRERREDGPAAAEVLRPVLRLARPENQNAILALIPPINASFTSLTAPGATTYCRLGRSDIQLVTLAL